mmetsp:Transcript_36558/g.65398  ORF Transcript_36558/g.65398 Transcript_36558/m.65398 type:complete len:241 (+) Transcript_36558:2521-3243(+)
MFGSLNCSSSWICLSFSARSSSSSSSSSWFPPQLRALAILPKGRFASPSPPQRSQRVTVRTDSDSDPSGTIPFLRDRFSSFILSSCSFSNRFSSSLAARDLAINSFSSLMAAISRSKSSFCCAAFSNSSINVLPRAFTCSFSSLTSIAFASVFCFALCLIFFALCAYCSVDIVSEKLKSDGLTVANIIVLELPPKMSISILVNTDSRIGMCLEPPDVEEALKQRPRIRRDMLIRSASAFC